MRIGFCIFRFDMSLNKIDVCIAARVLVMAFIQFTPMHSHAIGGFGAEALRSGLSTDSSTTPKPDDLSCKIGNTAGALVGVFKQDCAAQDALLPSGVHASGRPQADSCGHTPSANADTSKVTGKKQYSMAERGSVTCFPSDKTDCSCFGTTSLYLAGVNFKPGQPFKECSSSEEMIKWGEGSDCFDQVKDGKLQAGDVIVTNPGSGDVGHVIVIRSCDSTGDPQSCVDCESTGAQGHVGPSCWSFKDRMASVKLASNGASGKGTSDALQGGSGNTKILRAKTTPECKSTGQPKFCKEAELRKCEGTPTQGA